MRPALLGVLLMVTGGLCLPAAEERAEAVSPEVLIEQLSSDLYPVRVMASAALWQMGREVEPLLVEAAAGADPEQALRAGKLLRKMRLGIQPDTSPKVVALVERYESASASERVGVIRRLKQLGAWYQVLMIHHFEEDPETLASLEEEVKGLQVFAARKMLLEDEVDLDEVRRILELGVRGPRQMRALAYFLRASGTLESELRKVAGRKDQESRLWYASLLATANRGLEAAEVFEEVGEPMSAARLRLLAGDPTEWIRIAPVPEHEIVTESLGTYRSSVVDKWQGRAVPKGWPRRLLATALRQEDEEAWFSLGVLYALGAKEEADKLYGRLSPSQAFAYFDALESVDQALSLFGLDADAGVSDFKKRCEAYFRAVIERPDAAEQELLELIELGGFLRSRGMDDVLQEAFVPGLVELSEKDEEWFMDVSSRLASHFSDAAVISPVLEAVRSYAGDDEEKWWSVRKRLVGDTAYTRALWKSLSEFQSSKSLAERFESMLMVLGRLPDAEGTVDQWWQWATGEKDKGEKSDRVRHYALMLAVAAVNSDGLRFLELTDEMEEEGMALGELGKIGKEFRFAGYRALCLGSAERWDEVAELWQNQIELTPDNAMRHAYLAGALRNAGRPEEASKHDELASMLALGDVRTMRSIGQAYASSLDMDRAFEWWSRGATVAVDAESGFQSLANLLCQEAKKRGEWKLAASLGEMLLLEVVMTGHFPGQALAFSRGHVEVEMARGLSMIKEDRTEALRVLERCHQLGVADGSMADYLFPALRKLGCTSEHDAWFSESWGHYLEVIERYPRSHNTLNSAAWTASRACRELDEAEQMMNRALEMKPGQAAYLDTMGEVWFARRNREKAVEWSKQARMRGPGDDELMRQYLRFRDGAFPVR